MSSPQKRSCRFPADGMRLLKRLCETPGVSGSEDRIRQVVIQEVEPHVDHLTVDQMGNLNCVKDGQGSNPLKIFIPAHMDQIGFRVRSVESNGLMTVVPVGGWDPAVPPASRAMVVTKKGAVLSGNFLSRPIHVLPADQRSRVPALDSLQLDLGLDTADEAAALGIEIGTPVTLYQDLQYIGNGRLVSGPALDNRACVWAMIEILKRLQNQQVEVCGCATVQEEIGTRGAGPAAVAYQPDVCLNLDTTIAALGGGVRSSQQVTRTGGGVAIKVLDGGVVCTPAVTDFLREIAEQEGIPYQLELLPAGGTDARAVEQAGRPIAVGGLSLPVRSIHTPSESCNPEDLEAMVQLAVKFLERAHELPARLPARVIK